MKQNMEQQINELKQYYKSQLPNKIEAIANAWADYIQQPSQEKRQILYRQSLNISGSAGTYGYKDLSNIAKKINRLLREQQNLDSEDKEIIANLIEQLKAITKKIK